MKENLIIILLFVITGLSYESYSQILRGSVLDRDTNRPIDYAVIYFAGTFSGTNTDKEGNFELDISKNRSMSLTISALGYYSVNVTDLPAGKALKVYLVPKVFELNEIVIGSGNLRKNKREREKHLKQFRKQFLGETPNARYCKILNENDITFLDENDTLKAFASKPILIDNNALGYRVTFFLDKFAYDKKHLITYTKGNILFNQDLAVKESQAEKTEKKRRLSYYGSKMQFFRSLWDDRVDSEGFTIRDSMKRSFSVERLIGQDSSNLDRRGAKFLKYHGPVWVKYKSDEEESRLEILKDSIYIDRNGSSIEGIRWIGKIGKQRIAEILPFEYSPGPFSVDDTYLQQNPVSQEESMGIFNGNQKISDALPGEKVFLQSDRPSYMQGDTIWFKAYSWFGFDQLPDTVSKVLYVDLLSPKDNILQKRKLLIQNGTSFGEFSLGKEIEAGRYTIRAYTRWMQNENAGEPFYRQINIGAFNQNFHVECSPLIIKQKEGDSLKVVFRFYEIDQEGNLRNDFAHNVDYRVRIGNRLLNTDRALSLRDSREQVLKFPLPETGEKDSLALVSLSVKEEGLEFEKQFSIPLIEDLDLQFFPEGGTLVNGIESRIAFKATGTDGLSREVKGVVRETGDRRTKTGEEGEIVTTFESSHKGMGSFYFTPENQKKYTAFVEFDNREFSFPLPLPEKDGCVISVAGNDSVVTAEVKYSPSRENERMYVTGSAYGKIRFISPVRLTADSSVMRILLEMLPEGISRLTLLNGEFKPECERLIYSDKGERFNVEIKADSSAYTARSKVTLHIKTTNSNGEPLPANLSLAVTDKEQVIGESSGGISVYKLLESELKGHIEDPGFYFRGDSVNHQAMDLLLLSQGYRRFLPEKPAEIKYHPERGFDITGKVLLRGNNKKDKEFNYSDLGLTLLCPSEKTYFDQTRPDSTGRFTFQTPLMSGRPLSLLRAYTSNGKLTREKLPKEKSFRGDIMLDEMTAPKFTSPTVSEVNISTPVIDYVQQLQSARKTEVSKFKNGTTWQLNLPEVTVTAKYMDKYWYTRFEEEAKKIVDMDSLDPTGRKYGNLYDLLIREFGARKYYESGLETVQMETRRGEDYWFPIYLLNGQLYFNGGEDSSKFKSLLNMLHAIKVNEIKKLMVIPPGNLTYHYADPGILISPIYQSLVEIETYPKQNFYRGDPDGIKTFALEGLDVPRAFFSPRYEGLSKENPEYDGRATLYWKPVIRTNEKGESKVEFYTGDRKTEIGVVVEGIGIGSGITGEESMVIKPVR